MELVAAAKMRRAAAAVLATRRYAELAWELLSNLRTKEEIAHHPLLEGRPSVRTVLLLVISGNRGLVGAFNSKLVSRALEIVRSEGVPVRVVTAGRAGARLLQRAGVAVVADFPKKDLLAEPAEAAPISGELLRQFLEGEVDRVRMVYADYATPTRQEPRDRTLLPVGEPDSELGMVGSASGGQRPALRAPWYLFEPSPESVLGSVVPNLVSVQVSQALLETTASEHAARMVAMKNATENAEELTAELTLELHQARQQQITRELQEITAGSLTNV